MVVQLLAENPISANDVCAENSRAPVSFLMKEMESSASFAIKLPWEVSASRLATIGVEGAHLLISAPARSLMFLAFNVLASASDAASVAAGMLVGAMRTRKELSHHGVRVMILSDRSELAAMVTKTQAM